MSALEHESAETITAHNKSDQEDNTPPQLVTLDSPDDINEPRAAIDTGAEAAITNLLCLLHRPVSCIEDKPCPVKMHGATAKDTLITPVAKECLQIPATTLPGWTEVECCCSPCFTATPLNEQDLLLKATGRKSDCSGLTVHELFDEHPDHLQHALDKGEISFKKHSDTDATGKVMVTCHHKRNHQQDPVTTGILIPGAACTHLLMPPMLCKDHPLSTNKASTD